MMNKVKIVTDSTVDMTPEELDFYDVTMVPLSIFIDGETFWIRLKSNKKNS